MVSYFWSTFSCLTIGPHVWIPFSFTLSNFTSLWSCFSFHFHLVLLLGGYCNKFSVRPVWLIPSIFFYLQSGQHSPLALLPICLSLFHHVMQSYSLRTHSTLSRGTLVVIILMFHKPQGLVHKSSFQALPNIWDGEFLRKRLRTFSGLPFLLTALS